MRIGDTVFYIDVGNLASKRVKYGRVVAADEGLVCIGRELDRDQLLDGEQAVVFRRPQWVFGSREAATEAERDDESRFDAREEYRDGIT